MGKKLWIIVLAIIVIAVGGLSFWLPGRYVEQGLKQLEANDNRLFDVSVDKTSPEQFDVNVRGRDAQTPMALNVKNTLKKSIWKSKVGHEVYLDEAMVAGNSPALGQWLQTNLIDQPFLTGETTFDLLGNYTTHLESIAIKDELDEVRVTAAKIVGDITGNAKGDVTADVQWPGLTILPIEDEGELKILPISLSSKGHYLSSMMFIGEQKLVGEGFTFVDNSRITEQSIAVAGYTFSAKAEENDGRLEGKISASLDSIELSGIEEPFNMSDVQAEISIDGLEMSNFERLNVAASEMAETGMPSQEFMAEMNQIIRNGFSLGLNSWRAEIDGLSFNMDANLTLTENTVADLQNPMSLLGLLGNVTAKMNMAFDAGLTDIQELSDAIDSLQKMGALVQKGDQYVMDFSMENGLPKLNGEVLQLPGL
ncbi:MAG: DUF945 family protein [Reinekea sp.]